MNIEPIADIIDEMRKHHYGFEENVEVYLHPTVLLDIRDEYPSDRRKSRVRTPPPSTVSMESTHDDEFHTTEVFEALGLTFFEEPRLNEGEVIALDTSGINPRSGDLTPTLDHPACVQRITLISPTEGIGCSRCGEFEEIYVEGDSGEPYCSMQCLWEAYE